MQAQTTWPHQPLDAARPQRWPLVLGSVWLSLLTLLWVFPPWLVCPMRVTAVLAIFSGLLACTGWSMAWQPLVMWSGLIGLGNFTLALLIAATPPNAWLGLSAGCTLLALLDGSQHFAYLRHCQVEPGVLLVLLRAVGRLSGFTLLVGLTLGIFLPLLALPSGDVAAAGWLTIGGAGMFVGFLALFLFHTSRATGASS